MYNLREIKLTNKIFKNMIIYYARYKLAKEIFDSSSGLQLHDFPACSMYLFDIYTFGNVTSPL